jgi:hypothetical protein
VLGEETVSFYTLSTDNAADWGGSVANKKSPAPCRLDCEHEKCGKKSENSSFGVQIRRFGGGEG